MTSTDPDPNYDDAMSAQDGTARDAHLDLDEPDSASAPTNPNTDLSEIASDDEALEPETTEELSWRIQLDNPHNPFTAQLVFSDNGTDLLWWPLDPIVLAEILNALTGLKNAQLQAITGQAAIVAPAPVGATVPQASATDATHEGTSIAAVHDTPTPNTQGVAKAAPSASGADATLRSWWARHKIATAFLILIAAIFLFGLVSGGAQV